MTQASQNIFQQFKDGGVVPADLAGQSSVSKKYVDDQLAIRDANISAVASAASNAQAEIDSHESSTTAHPAQNITYSGNVVGASNVKQAIDKTDDRISTIVAQAGNDNTEIVDARGGYPLLGGRLSNFDTTLSNKANQNDLNAANDRIGSIEQDGNFEKIGISLINKSAVKIICYGDSITLGFGLSGSQKAYPQVLQERLSYIFDNTSVNVINKGNGGWNTDLGRNGIQEQVISQSPDLAIIMFGINDCLNGVPVERFRSNLTQMVTSCKKNNIKVVLLSPTPIMKEENSNNVKDNIYRKIKTYSKAVKEIAYENKSDFVDINEEFWKLFKTNAINASVITDAIHLNETGYKYIADIILAKLLCLNYETELKPGEYLPFNSPLVTKKANTMTNDGRGRLTYFLVFNKIYPGEYVRFLIYNNNPRNSLKLLVYQDTSTGSFTIKNFGSNYTTVGGSSPAGDFNVELPVALGIGLYCFDIRSEDSSGIIYVSGCQLVTT
ncbi:Arylesterase precursor [compost metagenome]